MGKEYQIAFKLGAQLESAFGKTFAEAAKSCQNLQNEVNKIGRNRNMIQPLRGDLGQTQKMIQETGAASSRMGNMFRGSVTAATGAIGGIGQAFGSAASSASSAFGRISSGIKSMVSAPLTSAIGIVKDFGATIGMLSAGALVNTGLNRLSAIENAGVSLNVMMGDAQKAQGFLNEVLAFAKTTPFAFPDLAESARNLVAFGMDAKKVVPTLKAIGDAAAASGKGAEGLNQVAGAFGDMQVSGTLSMDQINRLASAGVPALKILSNQTGKSVDEMKKQISSGSMSSVKAIDDLVKGMQEGTKGVAGETAKMDGIMEKMKDTWTGSVDSLKSSVSSTMATLMEPIKPYLQKGMKWVGDTFAKLPKALEVVGNATSKVVGKIKGYFSGIFDDLELYDHFDNLAYLVQNGFDEQMQRVTVNYFEMFGMSNDQAEQIASSIKSAWEVVFDEWYDTLDNLGYLFQNGFDEQMQRVTINYLEMFGMDNADAQAIVSNITSVFDRIAEAKNRYVEMFKNVLPDIMSVIGSIVKIIMQIVPVAIKIGMTFFEVGAKIVAAIVPIAAYLYEKLWPVLSQIFNFLAVEVFPKIANLISALVEQVSGLASSVGQAFVAMFNFVKPVLDMLADAFQVVFPVVKAVVLAAIDAVGGVLSGLLQTLGGIIDFVTGVFSGNWSQAWQGIVDIFGGIFKRLRALVAAPINAVINLVNQAIRAVNNISVDIPDWLGGGTLGFNIPEIPNIGGYADGGIVSSPELAWVGEGGDKEVVIPINNSNRSKNLHETAGRMLGVTKDSGGSGDINITVSNTINLSGSATEEDAKRVAKAVNDDLERRLRKIEERRRRVSFA
ncbi:tape measure protein [Paenibacillus larvae]